MQEYLNRGSCQAIRQYRSLDELIEDLVSLYTCPTCTKAFTLVPRDFETVLYKKLDIGAKLPEKAHENDAGYDLFALHTIDLLPKQLTEVHTGIAIACPDNLYFTIEAKSTFNREQVITKRGIFDSGYRGYVSAFMQNEGDELLTIRRWQKFAQIIFHPRLTVNMMVADNLPESTRGEGRFGSTGKF